MTQPHKVQVKKAHYDEEKDLVFWNVFFLDTFEEQSFCWPSVDLAASLGIRAEIPAELMHKFCRDIEGKEINLVIEGQPINSIEYDVDSVNHITDQIDNILTSATNAVLKEKPSKNE